MTANPEGAVKQFLDGLRLNYDSLLGTLSEIALDDYGLIIIECNGQALALAEAVKNAGRLREFVVRGGKVWLHRLEPESVSFARQLTGVNLELEAIGAAQTIKAVDDPVTTGLSNFDLYWHEPYVWDRYVAYRPTARYAYKWEEGRGKNTQRIKPLLKPAILVRVPYENETELTQLHSRSLIVNRTRI